MSSIYSHVSVTPPPSLCYHLLICSNTPPVHPLPHVTLQLQPPILLLLAPFILTLSASLYKPHVQYVVTSHVLETLRLFCSCKTTFNMSSSSSSSTSIQSMCICFLYTLKHILPSADHSFHSLHIIFISITTFETFNPLLVVQIGICLLLMDDCEIW